MQEIFEKHNVSEISTESLYALGYIKKNDLVKVLGNGDIKAKIALNVDAYSITAKTKIESAGGSVVEK